MKMIIKDTNGSIQEVEVTKDMQVDVQPGQQFFFTGADDSSFTLSDDNKDMRLNLTDENGETINISMPGLAEQISANDPTDPFSLTTALGVSTTREGDAEIAEIVNNPELEVGEMIDNLKEALAQSNSGADNDGVVLDDFGSIQDNAAATQADGETLETQEVIAEDNTEAVVQAPKARSSRPEEREEEEDEEENEEEEEIVLDTTYGNDLNGDGIIDESAVDIQDASSDEVINKDESLNTTIVGNIGEGGATLDSLVVSDGTNSVTVDVSTVTIESDGSYTIENLDLSTLNDGELTVTSSSTDVDGLTATNEDTISKDTVFGDNEDGSNEGISSDIIDASDSGSSQTDNITNDTTPTITGTTDANAQIVITNENGDVVGTVQADENGNYSITTSELSEGAQDLTITATDTTGNVTSTTQSIEIDTSVSGFTVDALISNESADTATVSGNTEANAEVQLTLTDSAGTTRVQTVTADENGDYTITFDTEGLKDGGYTIDGIATDIVGNQSSSETQVTGNDLNTFQDSFTVSDLVSNEEADTASVTGNTEPNATVELTLTDANGIESTVSVSADENGDYSITFDTSAMEDGAYSINGTSSDANGNEVVASQVTGNDLNTFQDSFTVSDLVSNEEADTASVTGNTEPNATVELTLTDANGVTNTVSVNADENGDYSITFDTSAMEDGAYTINGTSSDTNGNEVVASQVTGNDLNTFQDSFTVSDLVSNEEADTASVTGNTEPNATVELTLTDANGVTNTVSVSADENGDYSITFDTSAMEDGSYSINGTSSDANGNEVVASEVTGNDLNTFQDSISADIVDASDSLGEGTIGTNSDNITNDNTPTITGNTEPGATVVITDANGNSVGTSTADENGNYSVTTSPLADGSQNLTITATDSAGNSESTTQEITVDTSTTNSVNITDGNMSDADNVINAVEDNTISLSGSVEENSIINSLVITDSAGNSINIDIEDVVYDATSGLYSIVDVDVSSLGDGELTTSITSTDVAGNESTSTDTITKDATATPAPVILDMVDTNGDKSEIIASGTGNEAGNTINLV